MPKNKMKEFVKNNKKNQLQHKNSIRALMEGNASVAREISRKVKN